MAPLAMKRRKQTPGQVNYEAISTDGLPRCPLHPHVRQGCAGCIPRKEALEWQVARANTAIKTDANIRATMLRIRAENEEEDRRGLCVNAAASKDQ